MRDLSTLRRYTTQIWTVNEHGDPVELVEESAPRWSDIESGVAFSDWSDAAEHAGVVIAAPEEASLEVSPEEGTAVQDSPQA